MNRDEVAAMLAGEHDEDADSMVLALGLLVTPQRVTEYIIAQRDATTFADKCAMARRFLDEAEW